MKLTANRRGVGVGLLQFGSRLCIWSVGTLPRRSSFREIAQKHLAAATAVGLLTLGYPTRAAGADRFFTNALGGDFLNPLNWNPNSVPGAADNADFTDAILPTVTWSASHANANAFLNGTSGGLQAAIGTNTWTLTNSFVIGQNAGTTGSVFQLSGSLSIANPAGTARMIVGQNGKGFYRLLGGGLTADQLLVTNVSASVSNSTFDFIAGNLTLQHGSTILFSNSDLRIGAGDTPASINILGGVNAWGRGGFPTQIVVGSSNSAPVEALIAGASTVWSNRAQMVIGSGNRAASQVFAFLGASVTNSDTVFLGRNSSAANSLVVTDPGSKWLGTYVYLGDTASTNAQLWVTNGAQVSLSNDIEIGNAASAVSNLLVIAGNNSVVSNAFTTYVGVFGDGNLLSISNQGAAFTGNSYVGLNSDSNRAIVSGTNSAWNHSSSLVVGNAGGGNRLEILNGGAVSSSSGIVGGSSSLANNSALISGAGSRWTLGSDLYVGAGGSTHSLVISNQAQLTSSNGTVYIGHNSSGVNSMVIAGSGSRLASKYIYVGDTAATNAQLWLTNGGQVFLANDLEIGNASNAVSSLVVMAGSGSAFSNSFTTYVGIFGGGNLLTISNQAVASTGNSYVGLYSSGNRAIVSGPNSLWDHSSSLVIGSEGSSNQLNILNGGTVSSSSGILGSAASTVSNSALISGSGSRWSMSGDLIVGSFGDGNSLVVSNQALLVNSNGIVGANAGSSSNRVVVTGLGSVWTNSGNLEVGNGGSSSLLLISNGASVFSAGGGGGLAAGSANNQLIVTGPGSSWISSGDMTFGGAGPANLMVISNGGLVVNLDGKIGSSQTSSSNLIWVTDPGSSWTNRGDCELGVNGAGNTLVVSNSAVVTAGNTFNLGGPISGTNTALIVSGGNVVVSNATQTGILAVNGGRLDFNGGTIQADSLFATNNAGAVSNSIFNFNYGTLTTLNGSTFSQSRDLRIGTVSGQSAIWNMLGGTNKASLGAFKVVLGDTAGASGVVNVVGPATVWTNSGFCVVGNNGSSCVLVVSNGAKAQAIGQLEIGATQNSTNNHVVLTDPGSSWSSAGGNVTVGQVGTANLLVVSNGATLSSDTGAIGISPSSSNNIAIITGAGSSWSAPGCDVGQNGPGNTLALANGGAFLASAIVTVGTSASTVSNTLAVSGGNLVVTNVTATGALDVRRGQVNFSGGFITTDRLLLTNGASSVFNFAGGTLNVGAATVSNAQTFVVGDGTSAATLNLVGSRTNSFANGLTVRSNASLVGNGTISGTLTVQNGGTLAPGNSLGILALNNPPALQGTTVMEITSVGLMLPNDQIQVNGTVIYGGKLVVTNTGPNALTTGAEFPLFNASGFGGSFSSITLPTLPAGLSWTNKLLLDGSIQVLGAAGPKIGSAVLSGTNLVISGTGGPANATYWVLNSTNVALALTNWTRLLTNQFDGNGNFAFTTAVSPAVPRRFYVVQVP